MKKDKDKRSKREKRNIQRRGKKQTYRVSWSQRKGVIKKKKRRDLPGSG